MIIIERLPDVVEYFGTDIFLDARRIDSVFADYLIPMNERMQYRNAIECARRYGLFERKQGVYDFDFFVNGIVVEVINDSGMRDEIVRELVDTVARIYHGIDAGTYTTKTEKTVEKEKSRTGAGTPPVKPEESIRKSVKKEEKTTNSSSAISVNTDTFDKTLNGVVFRVLSKYEAKHSINVYEGDVLKAENLSSALNPGSFAKVLYNSVTGKIGLRNLSDYTWTVIRPDESSKECTKGGVAILEENTMLRVIPRVLQLNVTEVHRNID